MKTRPNPFLSGNLAPVQEEITETNLRVTGTLPPQLDGRYVRNGPNPFGHIDADNYHWFSGDGMVHGVRLRDGKAEWYRNRWVRDVKLATRMGEPAPASDWPEDHNTFAANTNVIQHAGKTYAIVEAGSPPIELSFDLDTVKISNLNGTLPMAFSAHPKRDPKTNELHVMTYWWGWGNQAQYVKVDPTGSVSQTVDIPLPGGPMIHDTSITEKYILVFDLPCVFNIDAAMKGAGLPYFWDNSYEARIGLLPRNGTADDITWISINPCYFFHPMNSYDLPDGRVVLDAARHPKMFDRERRGPSEGPPTIVRWVLNPATGSATEEVLDDRPQEFPRINESLVGLPNRYGYSAGIAEGFSQDVLIKADLDKKSFTARTDADKFGYGEPVFIPRTDDAVTAVNEDDGYVMALRQNLDTELSELAIFDARAFTDEPVAVVHLPARVPNGFHGNWMPINQ
jgi:carotenoid cleavage dioxygenase